MRAVCLGRKRCFEIAGSKASNQRTLGARAVVSAHNRSTRRRIGREKFVKLSIGFEVSKVVGATDMRTIDEYLRHGVSARRFRHGLPVSWVCINIKFLPLHSFFL